MEGEARIGGLRGAVVEIPAVARIDTVATACRVESHGRSGERAVQAVTRDSARTGAAGLMFQVKPALALLLAGSVTVIETLKLPATTRRTGDAAGGALMLRPVRHAGCAEGDRLALGIGRADGDVDRDTPTVPVRLPGIDDRRRRIDCRERRLTALHAEVVEPAARPAGQCVGRIVGSAVVRPLRSTPPLPPTAPRN